MYLYVDSLTMSCYLYIVYGSLNIVIIFMGFPNSLINHFVGLSVELTRMVKTKYSSRYNPDWENSELYPDLASWIQPVRTGKPDDANQFACKLCMSGPLSLSNMGVTAPRSHLKNTKDKNGNVKLCKHNPKVKDINTTKKDCVPQSASSESTTELSQSPIVDSPVSQSATAEAPQASSSSLTEVKTWYLSTAPPDVLKAWILWCLDVVYSHRSYHSAGGQGELFKKMFPDSRVAQEYGSLSRNKIAYIISHGLAPYYMKCIMSELKPPGPRMAPLFVSCLDESFNSVTCSKQMDIRVLFFSEKN